MTTSSQQNIRISEIFGPTIQGEGHLIGQPTVFVRTGGCDFRCEWCDTLYAVEPEFKDQWKLYSAEEILHQVEILSQAPLLITLSGGNPALQPLGELIALGHDAGYQFSIETQGSVAKNWFSQLDHLVLSPKPPSSGMTNDWSQVSKCLELANTAEKVFKIVVKDEVDYQFAKEVHKLYPSYPVTLQACNTHQQAPQTINDILERQRWLTERVCEDHWYQARVLPQLHTLLWGNTPGR
ncbi:MAG: 7-carboxy-7-deazaguanine synthase QueE [Gammaproteobacteria bacterium]|nr:7-carboxy-7-deazaguanine synthase QueE [Gammaproteobacteria bacterium]